MKRKRINSYVPNRSYMREVKEEEEEKQRRDNNKNT